MYENMLTQCFKHIYTMLEELFRQCWNTYFHKIDDIFTKCLKPFVQHGVYYWKWMKIKKKHCFKIVKNKNCNRVFSFFSSNILNKKKLKLWNISFYLLTFFTVSIFWNYETYESFCHIFCVCKISDSLISRNSNWKIPKCA